jgi:undecaprenyl-phosphate galactose phosphotransferase
MKRLISALILIITDVTAICLTFFLAYYVRVDILPRLFAVNFPIMFDISHFFKLSYLLIVYVLVFYYEKLYTRRFDFFAEVVYLTRGLIISTTVIAVIIFFSRTYEVFARTLLVLMLIISVFLVPVCRYLINKLVVLTKLDTRNAAVIGNLSAVHSIFQTLQTLNRYGYQLKGFIGNPMPADADSHLPYLGSMEKLPKLVSQHKLETLILVASGLSGNEMNQLINQGEYLVKELKIVSDSTYLKTIGLTTEYLEELLVLKMSNNLLSPASRFLKRTFDLCVSSILLILLLPLFLAIIVLLKMESSGPVFFIQERYGKNGSKFNIYKFRSMFSNAEERLQLYFQKYPEKKQEWEIYKKLKTYDPRVTRIGKILRRFSLDELPQLFNILNGDMSLVGPRPYLIRESEEIKKHAAIIFKVQSGLTGLWQTKGRNELSFDERIRLDEFYVRNWSFIQDIIIILKTFGTVIKGRGAY